MEEKSEKRPGRPRIEASTQAVRITFGRQAWAEVQAAAATLEVSAAELVRQAAIARAKRVLRGKSGGQGIA